MEKKVSRFSKKVGTTYTCHRCGKLTRETGNDESSYELCRKCFEVVESEPK